MGRRVGTAKDTHTGRTTHTEHITPVIAWHQGRSWACREAVQGRRSPKVGSSARKAHSAHTHYTLTCKRVSYTDTLSMHTVYRKGLFLWSCIHQPMTRLSHGDSPQGTPGSGSSLTLEQLARTNDHSLRHETQTHKHGVQPEHMHMAADACSRVCMQKGMHAVRKASMASRCLPLIRVVTVILTFWPQRRRLVHWLWLSMPCS